ncbi:esterase/lipase family protein [Nonomuraea endophytica]|uniref:esterase/lipase family protein n=1 Tax=Nonomuraea endophytica TaxID=714136 RepID=UPI0037CB9353
MTRTTLSAPAVCLVVVAGFASLFATYWDDAWHTDIGRDDALIPPHLLLFGSVAVVGLVVAGWGLRSLVAAGSMAAAFRQRPLLLVAGLAGAPLAFEPMRRWLERAGCKPVVAPVGRGLDCGERLVAGLGRTLCQVAEREGRPAAVIAHSRGGQVARVAVVRRPELVAGLVTLGSPLTDLVAAHRPLVVQLTVLGLAGSLGMPGVMRPAGLLGDCCRSLRGHLSGPFPAKPFMSLYTVTDQVVLWRNCLDPYARHQEVRTTHSGMLADAQVFRHLAGELSRLAAPAQPHLVAA